MAECKIGIGQKVYTKYSGEISIIKEIDLSPCNAGYCISKDSNCWKCEHYIFKIVVRGSLWAGREFSPCNIKTSITKKENKMNKTIVKMYSKTEDAVLVEKWFGSAFAGGTKLLPVIAVNFKVGILVEAKRLEKEEEAKNV